MMTDPQATVMVVHHEIRVCHQLTEALSEEGYRIIPASSGPSALAMVAEEAPDCILLDGEMPSLDGVAILRRLREQGHEGTVIVLTAQGTLQTAREAMLLDAYDYITMPFAMDFLKSVLREGVKNNRIPVWRDDACVH
jgi:DNA-binding NtrC family response regulator